MRVLLKIIYKTLLYTSLVWVLCLYLEFRLSAKENSYSYKIKNFDKTKENCEILILGNSEMLKGVNPDMLQAPAFNMAHVSQNFVLDEKILNTYLSQMPKLRIVILGVSYISFGDDLESGEESWRLPFYRKYYGLDPDHPFDIKDHSNILRYGPYEALKMGLNNFNVDLLNGMQPNGWMRTEGFDPINISDSFALQRAATHNNSLKEKNVPVNVLAMKKMLQILKDKNIKVKLVMLPVMHNYYNALNPAWIEKNDSIINVVHKEFNFDFINFVKPNDSLYNSLKYGFNDVDHLNSKGAATVGAMLNKIFMEKVF